MMQHYKTSIWFILFLLTACNSPQQKEEKIKKTDTVVTDENTVTLTPEQLKNGDIKTGRPGMQNVHTTLKVNGRVEVPPEKLYTISFPMPGYLSSCKLIPGTYVRKGALMATLEDAAFVQLQQDYLISKSKLEYAQADFERQEELNKTKSNSDKVFQLAKADFQSQKVWTKALSEKLKMIGIDPLGLNENTISRTVNIYAPIAGYVSKVNVNTGKYITPADALFELIDPSRLHLTLTVFEKDAQQLQVGQKILCYTNAAPGKKIAASIHVINQSINENRTVEVHCDFDQPDNNLLPGTFIVAEIEENNTKSVSLPDDAIVRWQNQHYVFIAATAHRFLMYQVKTGASSDGFTHILTELPQSDIVTHNAYALLMMLKNKSDE